MGIPRSKPTNTQKSLKNFQKPVVAVNCAIVIAEFESNIRVFISYSHDTPEQSARVLGLAWASSL